MNMTSSRELTTDVLQTAQILEKLAENESSFRLLVDSFRAQDHEAFNDLLSGFGLLEQRHLICKWLCSKECTLICFELCGAPLKDIPQISLREFAELTAKITSDVNILGRLVGAVTERDETTFRAIVEKLGLRNHCQVICHWICSVRCRLICELLCAKELPSYIIGCTHLVATLQQIGAAIIRLIKNPDTLALMEKGIRAHDCVIVRDALEQYPGVCHWICHWTCTWQCVRICTKLCRPFPPARIEHELSEIHAFAKALTRLAIQPELASLLLDAIASENAADYAELVKKLNLAQFCHQLCHWLCCINCQRYCQCVCPPPVLRPWFTHIGHFDIYADIDPATGLTNKALAYAGLGNNGGPGFAFFDCLELRGYCPVASPADGTPMKYRFLSAETPITGSMVCNVDAGTRSIPWPQNVGGIADAFNVLTFQTISIEGSPVPAPVPPAPGAPWYGPSRHVIVPDMDGWIAVDPASISGGFTTLLGFNTRTPFPGGDPLPAVAAGNPPATLKNGADTGIVFEATRVSGPASPPDYTNTLDRIHINNWNEVRLLDLFQFHSGGGTPCSPLSTALDIEYTTDHEQMAAWNVSVYSAAFPPSGVPPLPLGVVWPAGPTVALPRGDAGTFHLDISSWPTCSYTVTLTSRRKLTTGLIDDDANTIYKTFCIGARVKKAAL